MSLPTAKEITDLYLYGSSSIPDLSSDDVIREAPLSTAVSRDVDVKEYMATGAGRFATGDQFALVSTFFAGSGLDHMQAGESLTKAEYAARIGLTSYGLNVYQRNVDDGAGDYGERVFIWNSLQYKISDDAVFKVNLDGTRIIENFGILPVTDDNFDFQSDDAGFANDILESWTDPWGIGRQVSLNFTGSADVQVYDATDYGEDAALSQSWTQPSYTTLFESMAEIANELWIDGDTRFVDQDDRVIQYGSLGNDTLNAEFEQDWLTTISENVLGTGPVGAGQLEAYEQFGFHIVAGDGDDNVFGGEAGDYLDSGNGDDIIYSSDGATIDDDANDLVFAGAGNDVVSVGGGSDIVSLGVGDDAVHFVMPPLDNGWSQVQTVVWGGDGADSFYFANNAHVLSVNVDGMTEDLLKNLSTNALFSVFNQDMEWPYDYIIINLEQQDKIFVDGTEITTAAVVQDIENDDRGFDFDYTFDHHGSDGWDWYYSHSMTKTEIKTQRDYFDMPGFYSVGLHEGGKGLAANFGGFVLDGFEDGAAGIHFVGDGITGRLETTTTVQQINVTSSDTTTYIASENAAYIVPKTYDLVGDPVSEHEVQWEGFHLRPDGYEDYTAPTVDLTNLQRAKGTDADDLFTGDAGVQDFYGGKGRDTVDYSGSSDGVSLDLDYGGDGGDADGDNYDSVENVVGTAFDDTLWGSAAGNVFTGDAGDDSLYGWLGDDTLLGGAGNDHFEDGTGNDIVLGGEGDDFIVADLGNDLIDGGDGSDTVALSGSSMSDYTIFRTADDAVTIVGALDGVDTLHDVEIIVLAGQNYNIGDLAPVLPTATLIEGTAANDTLDGTSSNDIIDGLDGDDTITAGGGSDVVNAGTGNDVIIGGAGNDVVDAGDGDDTVVFAGEFSDFTLKAVDSHTVLVQADGINSIIRDAETITFDAPVGGSDHSVDVAAFLDEYVPREFDGTEGADTVQGTIGSDVIYGYGGNDTIYANGGDYVEAGFGNDVIHAGSGSNDIYGGTGSDTVIFDGLRSNYTLLAYDDFIQIDGPDTTTWVTDGEWLIFDDPNSEVDEIVNIDDFRNGDTGGGAEESNTVDISTTVATSTDVAMTAPSLGESASESDSEDTFAPRAEIISFPMVNTIERQNLQPIAIESSAHADAEDSGFGADVISLQDFVNRHQDGTADSDLWFEPEPIGSVI